MVRRQSQCCCTACNGACSLFRICCSRFAQAVISGPLFERRQPFVKQWQSFRTTNLTMGAEVNLGLLPCEAIEEPPLGLAPVLALPSLQGGRVGSRKPQTS